MATKQRNDNVAGGARKETIRGNNWLPLVKLRSRYIRRHSFALEDAPEEQMTKPLLVDHLTVCAKLARSDGNPLIEYLIRMALLEAKPKRTREQSGN